MECVTQLHFRYNPRSEQLLQKVYFEVTSVYILKCVLKLEHVEFLPVIQLLMALFCRHSALLIKLFKGKQGIKPEVQVALLNRTDRISLKSRDNFLFACWLC